MARPSKCRRICFEPAYDSFAPEGICAAGDNVLLLDEYEAIRLIDLEKFTHEQCAGQMGVSRTTVTEIYEQARRKIADSIVNGKTLLISGGNYRLCHGSERGDCPGRCRSADRTPAGRTIKGKGENAMRIAVTYENGEVFQHFGHTEQFKLYDVENGKVTGEQVVGTNGQGHGALAGFLTAAKADVLICGGIGGGAQQALAMAGIRLCGGVSGSADEAVKSFLAGTLDSSSAPNCDHHEHGHHGGCGEHHCGEDKHGCSGNGGHCGE